MTKAPKLPDTGGSFTLSDKGKLVQKEGPKPAKKPKPQPKSEDV